MQFLTTNFQLLTFNTSLTTNYLINNYFCCNNNAMNKLKKHIVSFFSILLALVILMTTSGFSIYTHHCNHNHTNYYSVFTPSAKCNIHLPKPAIKSCCNTAEPAAMPQCDTSPSDNGCCTNKTQVLKLDTKTVLSNSTIVIKSIETLSFIMLVTFNITNIEKVNTAILSYQCAESPPPLTTTEYLSYIQVYTI